MIDAHVHFWNFDPVRDSWLTNEMNAIRNDFGPVEFQRACPTAALSGCIAVQANQTEEENHFLLSLAKNNPIIKGIVGWVDILTPILKNGYRIGGNLI